MIPIGSSLDLVLKKCKTEMPNVKFKSIINPTSALQAGTHLCDVSAYGVSRGDEIEYRAAVDNFVKKCEPALYNSTIWVLLTLKSVYFVSNKLQ